MKDAFFQLSLAIVIQAIKDVRKKPDQKTIEWLLTEGYSILEICDMQITLEKWRTFVLSGCPGDWTKDFSRR